MGWRNIHTVLTICIFVLALVSLALGRESIDLMAALRDVFSESNSTLSVIFVQIRLPRVILAIVIGASLGVSGAAMQGLLRNPLASPGLVGSSSGAALFAVAVLYYGLDSADSYWLPLAGMSGALLATAVVYLLAGRGASVTTLILAGVAVTSLATAGMSLLLNLAPSPYAISELVLWTMGDFSDRSLKDLWIMLPTTLLGWLLLIGVGRQLDALTLGERTAMSMGINIVFLRWRVFLSVALVVGAAVSTVGMIGFVGLVAPHILRPYVGFQPGRLLFASALGGAVMMLMADIGVRLVPTQVPLKVGVLTALVGAPFFLHLILRSRREYAS